MDAFVDHALADQFERSEGAVAFVEMDDARADAKGLERTNAADAEQQLLAIADALVAPVEPRGQFAILRGIAVYVRIEEQQRIAPHRDSPHAGGDRSRSRVDAHDDGRAGPRGRLEREHVVVDVDVLFALPPLPVE